ncbi:Hypothetical predicted protein [Octopus vulgaris]|uniref:Uncharacterized protein n=1 Tax=Octopus vulgaris TaxID=6645 RepID=A0AA36AUN9_OCTVU|nr:Hypothetical predicted protein [Octopus vulgaris]
MERAARKVVDEKKSLRDVAVKQRIVDEINERKSKPKKATSTEKATKGKGKLTKSGDAASRFHIHTVATSIIPSKIS